MKPAEYAQVKELFARAIELPDSSRCEFIKRECDGNTDLERTLLAKPESAVKIYKALLQIIVTRIRNTDIELAMRKPL